MGQFNPFIFHHWQQITAFIVILLLIVINELLSQRKRSKTLSPQGAIDKINHEDAVVIDLRDQEAFSAGHIINAVRIVPGDLNANRLDKYKNKPIILVCARGLQAEKVANQLKSNGIAEPIVLSGGLSAWQTAGLPLVKGNK
jgi:rhodanese-related sulfurtransferase